MITKVTKGIKISVDTVFEGAIFKNQVIQFAYAYKITIDNQSQDTIQLVSRFWMIKDALNDTVYVEGEGVVGMKPVLQPQQKHTYSSGCLLMSPVGSMQGHYNMVNFTTGETFKVGIPNFKLATNFLLN